MFIYVEIGTLQAPLLRRNKVKPALLTLLRKLLLETLNVVLDPTILAWPLTARPKTAGGPLLVRWARSAETHRVGLRLHRMLRATLGPPPLNFPMILLTRPLPKQEQNETPAPLLFVALELYVVTGMITVVAVVIVMVDPRVNPPAPFSTIKLP